MAACPRYLAISAVFLLGCPRDSSDDAIRGGTAETGDSSDTGAPADLPMGDCVVDGHDPNGTRADAGRIEQNQALSATLCAGGDETDWYSFTLAVPSYVGVEVLFEKDGQDVALELSEHASGTLIERSEGGADIQATHQLLQPGTYDIEIQRVLGDPSYTLRTYALPTNMPPSTNMEGVLGGGVLGVAGQHGDGRAHLCAVFNQFGLGAWVGDDDIENDTQRFLAQCPASLNSLKMKGKCDLPGDATSCTDAGASNETDWAGTLWDFAKVVGEDQRPAVLLLLSDAFQLTWDPGSTTPDAYTNMRHAALVRFPNNGNDFHAAARANGTNR